MKYKVGDKVRIKSKEWYEENKNKEGRVNVPFDFVSNMAKNCGMIAEIKVANENCGFYKIDLDEEARVWSDEMFEEISENDKSATLSEQLIKDIANVIKNHNMGVQVSESEGKLIIEPLKVEEDLPIDAIVVCSDRECGIDNFHLRYYAGRHKTFNDGFNSSSPQKGIVGWKYIIEYSKFNPNDIEESLKYNIVK